MYHNDLQEFLLQVPMEEVHDKQDNISSYNLLINLTILKQLQWLNIFFIQLNFLKLHPSLLHNFQ